MKKIKIILGISAFALAMLVNLQFALDDYGLSKGNLHYAVLAQANAQGTSTSTSTTCTTTTIPEWRQRRKETRTGRLFKVTYINATLSLWGKYSVGQLLESGVEGGFNGSVRGEWVNCYKILCPLTVILQNNECIAQDWTVTASNGSSTSSSNY